MAPPKTMPRPGQPSTTSGGDAPTPEQQLVQQLLRKTVPTMENLSGEYREALPDGDQGPKPQAFGNRGATPFTTVHQSGNTATLYDKAGTPCHVPVQNLPECLAAGMTVRCPYCNGVHDTLAINACPGQEPKKHAECPICRMHGRVKVIPDFAPSGEATDETEEDPNRVDIMLNTLADPVARVKMRVYEHMAAFHPRETDSLRMTGQLASFGIK